MKTLNTILFIILLVFPTTVHAQLRKGEVSVDYRVEDGHYYAIVNRAGWTESKTVNLCREDDLYGMPVNHKLYGEKNAKTAYKFLFQPLEQYVYSGENVYFCPKGLAYLVNFAALMDNDGRRLCEKYHFFRLDDIRAFPSDPRNHQYWDVLLYGGMDYYADTEEMNKHSWSLHTKDLQKYYNDIPGINQANLNLGSTDDGTRAGCNNLKESKGEIKFIYSMGKSFANPHTGAAALEEVFRQDIRREQEYIVHLSTHCFSANLPSDSNDSSEERYKKFMMSSGLLFSGAGHTLSGETIPRAHQIDGGRQLGQMNDGLLYGMEIASLDMSWCSMVVLAACNTAVGTVTQDGILGLQTAFKEAGAHTLLMTLWSVNDKATSEFMKNFYTYLFSGKTKHESLELARADLMHSADFSDPIYWAPFIMLD